MREIDPNWHGRFQQVLDASEYNQKTLAEAMKRRAAEVTRGTINNWYKSRTLQPEYENIVAACRLLRVDPDWLLYGGPAGVQESAAPYASQAQAQMVPVVGTAQLGENGYWTELGYSPGARGEGVRALTDDPNAYALKVRGDSMEPAIREGWYVVVEPNRTTTPGEYVLVQTVAGQSMVKELLWQRGDTIALMSVNGNGRITFRLDEIESISPVGPIFPPSSIRHL